MGGSLVVSACSHRGPGERTRRPHGHAGAVRRDQSPGQGHRGKKGREALSIQCMWAHIEHLTVCPLPVGSVTVTDRLQV